MRQNSKDLRSDQLAPHNIEAEEAVLGSILINSESLYEVPFLEADDFFIVRHSWIWDAIMSIRSRRDPVDYLTVVNELEQTGHIDEVGGAGYILGLVNKTPSALNVEGYGRIVERMAIRRRLLLAAGEIARTAHSEETDIDAVVNTALDVIMKATALKSRKTFTSFGEIMSGEFDHQQIITKLGEMLGLPTGLTELDKTLLGVHPHELVTLAARPGMGKSAWLLMMALSVALRGDPVVFFSLEMSTEEVGKRAIAQLAEIRHTNIKQGTMTDNEWGEFVALMELHASLPLHIDDTGLIGLSELVSKCHRAKNKFGAKLIVVDYMQRISAPGHENRVREISTISATLKATAKALKIPIVAGAQLNRGVEGRADKRPLLSDLKESGSIEEDSDKVIFIYRDEYYDPDTLRRGIAELHVAKNRDGKTGMAFARFVGERMLFQDAEIVEFDDSF